MTLHTVLPPASDAKFIGDEPVWHDVDVAEDKYNKEILLALNWHNYCAGEKDYVKYIEAWIREHRPKTAKQDIAAWRDVSRIDKTLCAMARIHMQGFPLSEKHIKQLEAYVADAVKPAKKKRTATKTAAVARPTIQDRIKQQVAGVLSNLDVRVDDAFENNLATPDEIAGDILSQGFKGPQLKLVQEYLNRNLIEWNEAYSGKNDQLADGYKYVGKRNFKKIIDVFSQVVDSISQQTTHIKSQRIRKRKPVDKKKLASKLRFMKDCPELGIKSLNPVDIIGANMIWVYDTKKRRLGYYEAEVKNSLYVKGTKIEGYKVTCEKILRKPEEQLAEVLKLRKNQTVNWFDTIRAKCKDMNGRTNVNLILLRID
jgi:hypothetical protein